MTTLFEKLGREALSNINMLHRKKQIIAINHEPNGTCLVLKDASKILLAGLLEDDSRKMVGYLGFYGGGEHGLDTPAFAIKPKGYPERGVA